jgi:hypothetical protein
MNLTIKTCNCEHSFQDKVYGKQKRVHTVGKSNITCTVCGKKK